MKADYAKFLVVIFWTFVCFLGRSRTSYSIDPTEEELNQGRLDKIITEAITSERSNEKIAELNRELIQISYDPSQADLKRAQELIKLGADPNYKDKYGNSPLRRLSSVSNENSIAFAKILMESGADPNIVDVVGNSVLRSLTISPAPEDLELVEFLLENGANPNTTDQYGWTPLYRFTIDTPTDTEIEFANLLLKHGANPNQATKDGRLAIDNLDNIDAKTIELLQLLAEHGMNLNLPNAEGKTPLHKLVINPTDEDIALAKKLIELGANPNLRANNGDTVLSLALLFADH